MSASGWAAALPAVEPGPRTLRFPVTLTVRAHPNEALDGVARYHVEWGRSSRLKLRGAEEERRIQPDGRSVCPFRHALVQGLFWRGSCQSDVARRWLARERTLPAFWIAPPSEDRRGHRW